MTASFTSRGGGRAAANGFRHQYLRTLEAILNKVEEGSSVTWSVLIDEPDAESIDYRIVDSNKTLVACQVKSTYDPDCGKPFALQEAVRSLAALCGQTEAETYLLQTNRHLNDRCATFADALSAGDDTEVQATLLGIGADLAESSRVRFQRARIESDSRSSEHLRLELRRRLGDIRRSRRLGSGPSSSDVLLNHCLAEIFRYAADAEWSLKASEVVRILCLDDATLAMAVGAVDWGRIVAQTLPSLPAIPRASDEERIRSSLSGGQCRRSVESVVVSGLSGIGKSSLAARYAHYHATAYDLVIWLDAETPDALAATVQRALPTKVPPNADKEFMRGALLDWLHGSPLNWLLVLDNAPSLRGVSDWLPTSGSGHCLITTIDSTSVQNIAQVELGRMTEEEARDLALRGLSLREADLTTNDLGALSLLIRETERWPLAIVLVTAYLADSGRSLTFTTELISLLKAEVLDDVSYLPVGYPRSLIGAVKLALRRVAHTVHGDKGIEVIQRCSLLRYEKVPTAIVGGFSWDTDKLPELVVPISGQIATDHAVAALRRASLVTRSVAGLTPDPLIADVLTVNSIVADVVRHEIERDQEALVRTIRPLFSTLQGLMEWWTKSRRFIALGEILGIVEGLLTYADRQGLASGEALTIMGNLALVYQYQTRYRDALRILNRERFWSRALAKTGLSIDFNVLIVRIDADMVVNSIKIDVPPALVAGIANELLELVESGTVDATDDRIQVAARNLISSLEFLMDAGGDDDVESALRRARSLFVEAAHWVDDAFRPQRVEELIRLGKYDDAISRSELIESDSRFNSFAREERSYLLAKKAEAQFFASKYSGGLQTLRLLMVVEEFTAGRSNNFLVETALAMAGAAIAKLLGDDRPPWVEVEQLLDLVIQSDLTYASSVVKWKTAVLRFAIAHHRGESTDLIGPAGLMRPSRFERGEGGPGAWILFLGRAQASVYSASHPGQLIKAEAAGRRLLSDGGDFAELLVLMISRRDWDLLRELAGNGLLVGTWQCFGSVLVFELFDSRKSATLAAIVFDLCDFETPAVEALASLILNDDGTGLDVSPTSAILLSSDSLSIEVVLPRGFDGIDIQAFQSVFELSSEHRSEVFGNRVR